MNSWKTIKNNIINIHKGLIHKKKPTAFNIDTTFDIYKPNVFNALVFGI